MDSFVFYRSFFEAISKLPTEYRLELYEAICQYSLYGEVPELSAISQAILILIKPNIDASKKRHDSSIENGKRGGRPKKASFENLTETETKPKENLNVDMDVDMDADMDADAERDIITAESSDELPAETKTDEEKTNLMLPLLDGTEYFVTQQDMDFWHSAFPAVDIEQEIFRMKAWLEANPKNKKTAHGVKRFIVNWLNRSQDRAKKKVPDTKPVSAPGFDLEEFFNAATICSG